MGVKQEMKNITEKDVYELALKNHKEEMKGFPQSYEAYKSYETIEYQNARATTSVIGEQWYWTQGENENDNQALKDAFFKERMEKLDQEEYKDLAIKTAEELYCKDTGRLPEYKIAEILKSEEEFSLDDLINTAQEKVSKDKPTQTHNRDELSL